MDCEIFMEFKINYNIKPDGIKLFRLVTVTEASEKEYERVFNLIAREMEQLNAKIVTKGLKDLFEGFVIEYENALLVSDEYGTRFLSVDEPLVNQMKSFIEKKMNSQAA